ncbi:EamA family transporter [Geodermatophilus sp. DSM 45219]|uniref:EamA family transporter n=1 Tax=Geodermatophilus sp. DSM 45219 TaxID=1881103 RepID=UPI0015A2CB43|nr:EamA family transporter [Geodermatophilus sp. DSM 45219]
MNFVVIDLGLDQFPPLLFAALRFALVAVPAVFFVGRPGVGAGGVVVVGLFLGAGQFGLLFVGMGAGMPAGLASLVLQAQALFTVLVGAVLLGERPRRAQLLGIAVAAVGLAVIALGRTATVPLVALLLVLGAAASWGVGNVAIRRARPRSGLALVVWASLVPPLPLLGLSLLVEGPGAARSAMTGLTWGGVAALAYLVVLATLVGFGIWTSLLRTHPASTVAPFSLLVPVVGLVTVWAVLGEQPSAAELSGAGVVLVGLLLVTRAGASRRRSPEASPMPATASATTPGSRL